MKSLNPSTEDGFLFDNDVFTDEVREHILSEGFEYHSDDSYCSRDTETETSNKAYYKVPGFAYGDWPVRVYIFNEGIGVDVDYECGGNSSNVFWEFDGSFEYVYDMVVDYIKNLSDYAPAE